MAKFALAEKVLPSARTLHNAVAQRSALKQYRGLTIEKYYRVSFRWLTPTFNVRDPANRALLGVVLFVK